MKILPGFTFLSDAAFFHERMAVCDKTFQLYKREPYADDIIAIEPLQSIPLEKATAFDCKRTAFRHPREAKGLDYAVTEVSGVACCEPGSDCC